MRWTAIVPLKAAAERKTRLTGALASCARAEIAADMAAHVVATLQRVNATIRVLSPTREDLPGTEWEPDQGQGLNAELDRVSRAMAGKRLLIVHADLPLLGADDLAELIAAAERAGAAIAPDRHGTGTNALAMREAVAVGFAFGPDSLARHRQRLPGAVTVLRDGLAIDIDTADDLAAAAGVLPLGRW